MEMTYSLLIFLLLFLKLKRQSPEDLKNCSSEVHVKGLSPISFLSLGDPIQSSLGPFSLSEREKGKCM